MFCVNIDCRIEVRKSCKRDRKEKVPLWVLDRRIYQHGDEISGVDLVLVGLVDMLVRVVVLLRILCRRRIGA